MIGGFYYERKTGKTASDARKRERAAHQAEQPHRNSGTADSGAEAAEVNEMVRSAKVSPEQLAALLRQSANATPNPAALAVVGAVFAKEEDTNDED
ncbi:DUF4315 family protein [Faecalibacterium sp. OF04-11AC]|uniref:DUF4315 family protein n=1 Tax=Faecalibacterium sp. OF04-11AC TaxID=2293109 RepID=UPI000E83A06B|nr:DUF4315 family protein [Faecalibacterium sp. OF04-11AC]RGF78866.1 DUF4315 family protein [Faecalibacterium sp. OF04-11AC]